MDAASGRPGVSRLPVDQVEQLGEYHRGDHRGGVPVRLLQVGQVMTQLQVHRELVGLHVGRRVGAPQIGDRVGSFSVLTG
jgi:hypothetical protein